MVKPIKNQILVKPFLTKEKTESGIFVPDSCRKPTSKCEVIAVGNGTKETPMKYKAGDIVFRVKDWGLPIEENGEAFFMMDQNSILAIVKD